MRRMRRRAVLEFALTGAVPGVAFVLAGCAVGPNFTRPAAPDVKGYAPEPPPASTASAEVAGGAAQHIVSGLDLPGQWWELFHSEPLNRLVEQSLKANPTIDAAEAALRQAQENVKAQQAAFFPTVSANFAPTRYKDAVEVSPTLQNYVPYFNLYNAQVNVSYTLDIWGQTRREVESLEAQAEYQRFQLEAAYLTLTSNVVTAAVQEASLRGQIAATKEIVKVETESLELLRKQLSLGQIAGVDVAAQEAALAQAETALPPLEKQLAQQRDLLAALAGRFPDDQPAEVFELDALKLPEDLPLSLPSKLVEQRPDIRSAESELHEASADVGVAIADMLPNLTLAATDGTTATKLGQLFMTGNGYATLGASLTQTVFDGGALIHKKRAADAALDQAAAQYKSTVISAFQNVADSLRALQSDADALKANEAAKAAAADSLGYAKRQLELGSISYLGLLNAQQTYQQAVVNFVQAQASRYADTAALFQSLGGGWWNRPSHDTDKTRQAGGWADVIPPVAILSDQAATASNTAATNSSPKSLP